MRRCCVLRTVMCRARRRAGRALWQRRRRWRSSATCPLRLRRAADCSRRAAPAATGRTATWSPASSSGNAASSAAPLRRVPRSCASSVGHSRHDDAAEQLLGYVQAVIDRRVSCAAGRRPRRRDAAGRSRSCAATSSRGRTVFDGKGRCATCHRVNGAGPRLAPDLSEIGTIRPGIGAP